MYKQIAIHIEKLYLVGDKLPEEEMELYKNNTKILVNWNYLEK